MINITFPSPAGGSAALEAADDDWETPHGEFEAFVGEVVRVRLGRHLLAPPGPTHVRPPDAHALFAKVTGEILEKERQVGVFYRVPGHLWVVAGLQTVGQSPCRPSCSGLLLSSSIGRFAARAADQLAPARGRARGMTKIPVWSPLAFECSLTWAQTVPTRPQSLSSRAVGAQSKVHHSLAFA